MMNGSFYKKHCQSNIAWSNLWFLITYSLAWIIYSALSACMGTFPRYEEYACAPF